MFFVPSILITILTFPGVIVHELAHQIACRIMKVPVFQVCYFKLESPNGYVLHGKPERFIQTLLIALGPFILNTLLGVIIFAAGSFSLEQGWIELFLMWLGISITMHAFPSEVDLNSIFDSLKKKEVSLPVRIIIYPIAFVMFLGTVGRVAWLDFAYSIVIVGLTERLILM